MQLSTNFCLDEWACNDAFRTPYPGRWVHERLMPQVHVLEKVRHKYNQPIIITSGYRTPEYNRTLPGAARRSQHMEGRATDFRVKNVPIAAVHRQLRDWYDQGEIHIGGLCLYKTFVHIDIRQTNRLVVWNGSKDHA